MVLDGAGVAVGVTMARVGIIEGITAKDMMIK
jgi:F0F1-type ATP synthase membrane subunit c/vacuolar-type H+-ATPase subunit K